MEKVHGPPCNVAAECHIDHVNNWSEEAMLSHQDWDGQHSPVLTCSGGALQQGCHAKSTSSGASVCRASEPVPERREFVLSTCSFLIQTQWYRLLAYLMEMLDGVGVHVKDLKLQKSINGIGLV